ncbi:MAG: DUF4093 domain-containing protein [Oscillospiraceae bacterium]|nr:DUF4093 domain-containing protein [Oscillospiraceae bacterium]
MDRIRIKEALVVEGKYDKNTLAQLVDAPIFVTEGFGIFKDPEKLTLLRAAAEKRGLIVLTDSDGAGLVIRNHLKGAIDPALVKHAYIPDVFGKEKRKAAPGKEGKLGVEGMTPAVLLQALRNAGATILEEPVGATMINGPVGAAIGRQPDAEAIEITKTDLYELGLTGRPDSKEKRKALQKALGLPENLSTNALLTALNCIITREELAGMM